MAISLTLEQYLNENGIDYDTLSHTYTTSASKTAEASHIPGSSIAKAVVLKEEDDYFLAVLPASNHIQFDKLQALLDDNVDLATEEEVESLFYDCELGAIPVVGKAYGLSVVLDRELKGNEDIYFEGGDHATLVKVNAERFDQLMDNAIVGRFSSHD